MMAADMNKQFPGGNHNVDTNITRSYNKAMAAKFSHNSLKFPSKVSEFGSSYDAAMSRRFGH
jgi:hypothetical protein